MKNFNLRRNICTFIALVFIINIVTLASMATTKAKATPTPVAKKSTTKSSTTNKTNTNTRQNQSRNNRQDYLKPTLDKLVKSKAITVAQETKIIAYQNKQTATRQAEMKKMQNMTDAQRKAYFQKQQGQKQNFNQRQNQFADLVKNKTITQKQADAIEKAISANRPAFGNRQNNNNNNNNNNNAPPK
jgi:hypothetical protein